jgi:acetate---CoA ligase (ADP-forming)
MFEALLKPRGVAVIGASQNATKLGYGVARNLVVSEYAGCIHFVNPHGGMLFDRPLYPDLASVPDPVDLAVILIPAAAVPQALEDCGRRGIRAAIIGAGGFRETGPQGLELEQRCLDIARRHGLRVLGPNCIGYLDTHLPIDTTFLPLPGPIPGDIAFLSHSGAICEVVIDWARGQGFGLSRLISLGNQMDLTEAELLPVTARDPNTRVLAMYLEGVGDGRDFIRQARKASAVKPVVAIKVGRTEHGRRAVSSHTGALAGRDIAYQAAFRKAGVIRADSSEEMFDWARALAWCPLPAGRRMAVLTNAGGPGAIAVDALDADGLLVAGLHEHTRAELRRLLPQAASLTNPVDMLAGAGPAEYAGCLRALLADPGVDGVIMILPPPPMTTAAEVAGAVIPMIKASSKPVVIALMGEELIAHAARLFRQARIPDYRFPERAASALRVLVERAEHLAHPPSQAARLTDVDRRRARRILTASRPGSLGFLPPQAAEKLIAAYGIGLPPSALLEDEGQAAEAARRLKGPLVVKAMAADLPHKSDVGGVVMGVIGEQALRQAYQQVTQAPRRVHPDLIISGALAQETAPAGQDVIVGVVRDDQFGPLVMFGSGGVEVEGLGDVAFALAPLSLAEADWMLEQTWAGRKLSGYRNLPPADRQAAVQVMLRLGQLMTDFAEIVEIEVNPLRVFSQGSGAWALDTRVRVAGD